VRKVMIAAHELGLAGRLDCVRTVVATTRPHGPLMEENPLSKIPTLVLDDGTALYDSRVIAEFLDGKSPISRLIPEDLRDRVAVRRWEALADGVLDAGLLVRYESLRDKKEQSKDWSAKQLTRMKRGMAEMASELAEKPWCHGERYSLADIALGCCVGWLGFRKPGDVDWLKEYPPLARHYEKLMARPAFADTVPRAPK
jgi:glutathione S-transferase